MRETRVVTVDCPWCGEAIDLVVDPSGARRQSYVEDCSVCCRPCRVVVRFDDDAPSVRLEQE